MLSLNGNRTSRCPAHLHLNFILNIGAITYNEGIASRMATFETRERMASDIALWFAEPRYPRLVAEREGQVVG